MKKLIFATKIVGFASLSFFQTLPAASKTFGNCQFDAQKLQFSGSPAEQSACLLRKVKKFGRIDDTVAILPDALSSRIGKPTGEIRNQFKALIDRDRVSTKQIGGSLDTRLSRANDDSASAPTARYFVIHDTSTPNLGNVTAFPSDIDVSRKVNNLQNYAGKESKAHIFVNRKGESLTGHDFIVPWRATKLELKQVGSPAKGLFLHIELIQPRRRDPAGRPKNDAIAPLPGFTDRQYERLALLYAAASIRAGQWLIPAFHAALDQGLRDGHDDPQNFELDKFGKALEALMARVAS